MSERASQTSVPLEPEPQLRGRQPVLVLDGDWASTLAIVRCLGLHGIPVDVGAAVPGPLAGRSRYCREHFVHPDPMADVPGFRRAVEERLRRISYALVIPVTDRTIVPLMEDRTSLERLAPLAIAANESIHMTLSKNETFMLSQRLGVPVPSTRVIAERRQVARASLGLDFPLVLKPDRSKVWGIDFEARDLSVTYANEPGELAEKLNLLLSSGPVLLQEKVTGQGVGVGILAHQGELLFAFQYRRLHEVPLSGGASSYRTSERLEPELLGYAQTLVEGLRWDGVAMLEFKQDRRTQKTWLIEINGRFWGSLPLPVAAGAAFPLYLYQMMVEGRREFPSDFRLGVRCRSLRREGKWFAEALLGRWRPSPGVVYPGLGRILIDGLRILNPLENWDTLSLSDPRPGIAEVSALAAKAWRRLKLLGACAGERRRMRRLQAQPQDLVHRLRQAQHVMVVCRGNVMRSVFAQRLLEQAQLRPGLRVRSTGLEAHSGRPADPTAIFHAHKREIDLRNHSAEPLTRDLAAWSDVLLVMEAKHLVAIRRQFPEAIDKSFLLCCLEPKVRLEISDPVFQVDSVFARCFDQVEQALRPIIVHLAAPEELSIDAERVR